MAKEVIGMAQPTNDSESVTIQAEVSHLVYHKLQAYEDVYGKDAGVVNEALDLYLTILDAKSTGRRIDEIEISWKNDPRVSVVRMHKQSILARRG